MPDISTGEWLKKGRKTFFSMLSGKNLIVFELYSFVKEQSCFISEPQNATYDT